MKFKVVCLVAFLCGVGQPVLGSALPLVDLIVEGDYVVTMDGDDSVIEHGAVAIRDGYILAVAPAGSIHDKYRAEEVMSGRDRVVMPGIVNGHSHAAMTLLRGIADDLSLYEWLNEYIFPAEVAFVDAEFVEVGTWLACWEMVRGGTTTFVDMYYYPETVAKVVDDCGMRALVSATVIDQKSPDAENAADSLDKAKTFVRRWQGRSGRVTPIFGPHANYTLNAEQLTLTRQAAQSLNTAISVHMAESRFEMDYVKEHYRSGSVTMFDSIGFFEGPTIAAHMVWPSKKEIEILASRDVGVIYNPTSNMKTAAGVAPIAEMLKAGVTIGLGTDGAASNNDLDMWEEMRLGALLQKVDSMNPELLPAGQMLAMATRDGAKAIGLENVIGSLVAGKRADLIQVALTDVHHIPVYDVISHLVYVTDEQDVVNVVVDGNVLMRDRQLLRVNEDEIKEKATLVAQKIRQQLIKQRR